MQMWVYNYALIQYVVFYGKYPQIFFAKDWGVP